METVSFFLFVWLGFWFSFLRWNAHFKHSNMVILVIECFTESHNGWDWNKPLEVIWPMPSLLKQGHVQPLVQACVQVHSGVEALQGNLFQCLVTHTVKEFTYVQRKTLCFSVCPSPLVLSLSTVKSLAPSLHPPFRSISLWTGSLSLSSQERCSNSFIIFVALCWTELI